MNIKNGVLQGFNQVDYTALVKLSGSHKDYLEDIAVARNIEDTEMITGRKVVVLFFDTNNARDAVVIGVYV